MNVIQKALLFTTAAIAIGLAGGCASHSALENDFGKSVRHMTRSQTLNPAPVSPAESSTVDGDGDRLMNVLDAYREDVSKPEDVSQDIVVNVGR